jgi:hypothetical protein
LYFQNLENGIVNNMQNCKTNYSIKNELFVNSFLFFIKKMVVLNKSFFDAPFTFSYGVRLFFGTNFPPHQITSLQFDHQLRPYHIEVRVDGFAISLSNSSFILWDSLRDRDLFNFLYAENQVSNSNAQGAPR